MITRAIIYKCGSISNLPGFTFMLYYKKLRNYRCEIDAICICVTIFGSTYVLRWLCSRLCERTLYYPMPCFRFTLTGQFEHCLLLLHFDLIVQVDKRINNDEFNFLLMCINYKEYASVTFLFDCNVANWGNRFYPFLSYWPRSRDVFLEFCLLCMFVASVPDERDRSQ